MNLNDQQKEKLEKLATENDLRFIVLFGSQASGAANKQSDYDVALMSRHPQPLYANFNRFTQILDRLSNALQVPEQKLDLTDLHNEDILLRYQIVLDGELLVGDIDDYENFRVFTVREYQGAVRLRELATAVIKRRQELLRGALA
ncbi:MAG: nucleotidyltransferase domain-containing protein [Patescibacteria group bacterium]